MECTHFIMRRMIPKPDSVRAFFSILHHLDTQHPRDGLMALGILPEKSSLPGVIGKKLAP
jgi:hypothetical protein